MCCFIICAGYLFSSLSYRMRCAYKHIIVCIQRIYIKVYSGSLTRSGSTALMMRSTLTDTLAPELPEPWLDILDDSLEHFLNITFADNKKKKAS